MVASEHKELEKRRHATNPLVVVRNNKLGSKCLLRPWVRKSPASRG